jgi:mono/diheme cytochrome c family protein
VAGLARLIPAAASFALAAGLSVLAQQPSAGPTVPEPDFGPKDPITARSPLEQAKTFILPPGYRMDLVAAEPDVINPVAVEFDGNGRMFVVEMRTYMLDADGRDRFAAESRISRWESTRADGVYDRHTVFADGLVLPRMVLPFGADSILTNETNSNDILKLTDTDGDGRADRREVFYTGVGHAGNLEHQQSGFLWGLDNWIYSTYNAFRFRWTPSGIRREPTGVNFGQWGLAQDDDGKMWFVEAGGENGPMNFQVPIHYGGLSVGGALEPDFRVVWPAPGIGDTQGGMARVRMPAGSLNHFTATAGPQIVRGDRLPADLLGDLLFAEPVGRLIRRAKIVKNDGMTVLRNAHPGSEFLMSTDMLFRPVNLKTAPDGTLFIVDMYRGIIQESEWTQPGSYLRTKIEQYALDKVVGHGRIWRLRFDGVPARAATQASPAYAGVPGIPLDLARPRMLEETPAQLVRHLSHPNGWWRDTAQQLLVLRQDTSVVPALEAMSRHSPSLLGRVHAMWTLEGLGALRAELVRELLSDPTPRLRVQALRASESLYKAGDRSFEADYHRVLADSDADVALQGMLTLSVVKAPATVQALRETMDRNPARGVQAIGKTLVSRATAATAAAGGRGGPGATVEQRAQMERGRTAYLATCVACHGDDGRGTPLEGAPAGTRRAPALEGSPRVMGHRDHVIKVLLHGLTGPLEGLTYSEVMIPLGSQSDSWLADVASYVRNAFGNAAPFLTPGDVATVRRATSGRTSAWTAVELAATVPRPLDAAASWSATASHNSAQANRALGTTIQTGPWTSGTAQSPGMWFQVELPAPVTLVEVQMDTTTIGGARGGGGAGRGRAAGPAPLPESGFPRGYRLELSDDGSQWTAAAEGAGAALTTTATFPPARTRFVRITQTADASNAPNWIIQRIRLYEAP